MALDRIQLANFRNHRDTALSGTAHFNLLIGENGAGKTNMLEAISLLSPGRGLRHATLPEMASQSGPGGFAISADLAADGEALRLGTGTMPGVGLSKSTRPKLPPSASPNGLALAG
jgi:DNA replication and repair protein RecF